MEPLGREQAASIVDGDLEYALFSVVLDPRPNNAPITVSFRPTTSDDMGRTDRRSSYFLGRK